MAATVLAVVLIAPTPAGAAVAREEADGARVLQRIESGGLSCDQVTASRFDHVGEYAMGRALGSTARHEAMNETMTRMMGEAGETRMHVLMGRRYAGCGGPTFPARFGRMMGLTGMMAGYGSAQGSMMGSGFGPGDHHDNDLSAAWIVAGIVILIAASGVAFLVGRGRRRDG
jgi:hypothetical protein